MTYKILLFPLILFFSCQITDGDTSLNPIDQELMALSSDIEKKAYLEELFKMDQKYRQGQSSTLMQRYGKTSEKYLTFMEISDRNDSLNLIKIERFIEKFGYPDINKLGALAAQAPWAVIHHADNYEERLRNFKVLHQAYQKGNIDGGAFALYLERMYNIKFRQRYPREDGAYVEQEKIDALIEVLKLNE